MVPSANNSSRGFGHPADIIVPSTNKSPRAILLILVPSTNNSPRAFDHLADIGVSGWYRVYIWNGMHYFLYIVVWYCIVCYKFMSYNSIQYYIMCYGIDKVWYDIVSIIWHHIIWYFFYWYGIIFYDAILYHMIQYCLPWNNVSYDIIFVLFKIVNHIHCIIRYCKWYKTVLYHDTIS